MGSRNKAVMGNATCILECIFNPLLDSVRQSWRNQERANMWGTDDPMLTTAGLLPLPVQLQVPANECCFTQGINRRL